MTKAKIATVQIRPVLSSRDKRRFLDVPYKLYRNNPHWIAPLRIAQRDILNTKSHPFYRTSDAHMLLAEREGRVVGRVMAILNRAHNEFHNERTGFFGFFEVENDPEASTALFDAARDWLRGHGAQSMRGPANPSTNYECGLLVEGFDLDPAVMMPYNPPYYAELLEAYGMKKVMDLHTFAITKEYFNHSNKLQRVAQRLRQKSRISVRSVNTRDFKREVEAVRRIYNEAWSPNWGFVPVSEEEFEHLAKDLKQIVDPRIAMIAEQETDNGPRPVAFFLAVPDINCALKKLRGRLLPLGLPKLLWHSRRISSLRVITMGVVPELQNIGIGAVFLDEIYRRGPAAGYVTGEMGWVLENNVMMNRTADLVGGRRFKTYRFYEIPT